jgi:hypothetical protein
MWFKQVVKKAGEAPEIRWLLRPGVLSSYYLDDLLSIPIIYIYIYIYIVDIFVVIVRLM